MASPDLKISWICLDDIAAYLAEALARVDLPSGRYRIGGPEALTGDDMARNFRHAPTSLEVWAARQDWNDPADPALAVRMAGLSAQGAQ